MSPASAKRGRMDIEEDDRENSENNNSSDEDIGMEIGELGGQNVRMELKGLSIDEEDFMGIKQLLIPLLPKSNIIMSDVTDNIIGQNFVGHIIKQVDEQSEEANEEDPVLSVSTVLPLGDQKWVETLKSFCLKKCQSANEDEKHLQDFFAAKNNAWFINSRFINFPPRAEGLLSLLEDVDAAAKKQHKSGWKFDNILLVVMRLYPKTTNEDMHKEILYRNAEDELFEQGAYWKMEYNAEQDIRQDEQNGSGWEDEELYTQHRMLVLLKYEKFKELLNMLPMWLMANE